MDIIQYTGINKNVLGGGGFDQLLVAKRVDFGGCRFQIVVCKIMLYKCVRPNFMNGKAEKMATNYGWGARLWKYYGL